MNMLWILGPGFDFRKRKIALSESLLIIPKNGALIVHLGRIGPSKVVSQEKGATKGRFAVQVLGRLRRAFGVGG